MTELFRKGKAEHMEKKKSQKALLVLMGVLILVEIVTRILIIQKDTVIGFGVLLSLVFTALYGFWLYKKPHGNLLKVAMLLFAFFAILSGSYLLLIGKKYHLEYQMAKVIASAAVFYCAGRLNRIDQNKYIMPVIGLVYLGVSIYAISRRFMNNTATVLNTLQNLSFTINYCTLMIAYFVRYDEHRLAGLIDAPKK